MKDVTVIIPIDKFDDEVKGLLKKSFDSIEENTPTVIVGPTEVLDKVKESSVVSQKVQYVTNENTNLPTQINKGVDAATTKYFTVLEYDDYFTPKWFKNVQERIASEPGAFAYLPINEVFSYTDTDHIVGYTNEPVWASSFSEKLGYFDTESLGNYVDVACSGGLFDREAFLEVGGLKESMKVSFWYELMLRADYKSKKIYVVPKVGYRHCIERPGSLLEIYKQTLSKDEASWWLNLAKQEHFFKKDRNKTYQK